MLTANPMTAAARNSALCSNMMSSELLRSMVGTSTSRQPRPSHTQQAGARYIRPGGQGGAGTMGARGSASRFPDLSCIQGQGEGLGQMRELGQGSTNKQGS